MSASNPARAASASAIQSHYDVGTAFYRLWLDPSLAYSCALWAPGDTLEAAQRRKLVHHAERSAAHGAARVLEIGCGWGSMMSHLVRECDVKSVVGLTLSADQARHIEQTRDPRVQVRLQSWEEYQPDEPFDAIISIGAFEHFVATGHDSETKVGQYRKFFERCRAWLKPGGQLSLQTICYEDACDADFPQFFTTDVFPESALPQPWEIFKATSRLFETLELRMDREHYLTTLKHWFRNLRAARSAAVELVGSETVDRYEKYLQFSMLGFHARRTNLARLSLRRLDPREAP